jgi:hypothetical protein
MTEEVVRNRTSWPCVKGRLTDIRICRDPLVTEGDGERRSPTPGHAEEATRHHGTRNSELSW